MKNKYYNFLLVLEGLSEINIETEDKLFESGCDDATLSIKDNIGYLEFDRESISMQEAIVTAITNVVDSGLNVRISAIEPGEYVTTSEIARRINKSRQYIHRLKVGESGFESFPAPISGNQSGNPIYRWSTVVLYFYKHKKFIKKDELDKAQLFKIFNAILDNNYNKSKRTTKNIIRQLKSSKVNQRSNYPKA